MTKIGCFSALTLLACGLSFGAPPRPELSTYVDGNIAALKPNTGGTLVFNDTDTLLFKTGLAEVEVPYTGIHKAELGAAQVHPHGTPAYKVWALHKRFHKNETQLLTLEFKSRQGDDQLMTLELAKPAATSVLAEIQDRTTKKPEKKAEEWWGDRYWKTQRNQSDWDKK
jgi:hypothetical protein